MVSYIDKTNRAIPSCLSRENFRKWKYSVTSVTKFAQNAYQSRDLTHLRCFFAQIRTKM